MWDDGCLAYSCLQLSRLWLRRLPEHVSLRRLPLGCCVQLHCFAGLFLRARPTLLTHLTGSLGT